MKVMMCNNVAHVHVYIDGSKLSIHDLRKVLVGFLSTDQYELYALIFCNE
jgi:hypothetical protein